MMSPTYTLSKEEKKFLACFYAGHVELLQPMYKGWVSLYSYLNNTHESIEQQKNSPKVKT
jgi:hypothetical protein